MKPLRPIDRSGPVGRAVTVAALVLAGLVGIVGSGGGALSAICDTYPDSCGPITPVPSASIVPDGLTAQVGTSVSFTARTRNADGPFHYAWQRSDDGGTTFADIVGASASSYSTGPVNLADDGAVFRVVVDSGSGRLSATSKLVVSSAPPIVFSDGDFAEAQWVAAPGIVAGNPSFSHSEETVASGGHPGAYRRMTVQVAAGSSLSRVIHLSTTAVYAPQVHGAIYVIDYAEDCALQTVSDVTAVEAAIAIEQSGRRYITDVPRALCTRADWSAVRRAGLRAIDFIQFDGPACQAGEACPDFSAGAAPIRLGFDRIAMSVPGSSLEHAIDNWRVSVWRR